MSTTEIGAWRRANMQYLLGSLEPIAAALERLAGVEPETTEPEAFEPAETADARQRVLELTGASPPLDHLYEIFGLSQFERDILLACAGVELESSFSSLCALAQHDAERAYLTFGLALQAFADPDWGAFLPTGPLRTWGLITLRGESILTRSSLRIDEAVLHYLMGYGYVDDQLASTAPHFEPPSHLVTSQHDLARQVARMLSQPVHNSVPPVVHVGGDDPGARVSVAAVACEELGLRLRHAMASALPVQSIDVEQFQRRWAREVALGRSALFIDCESLDVSDSARMAALNRLLQMVIGVIFVSGDWRPELGPRPVVTLHVNRPTPIEQRAIWAATLGEALCPEVEASLQDLVDQFNLTVPQIEASVLEGRGADAAHGGATTPGVSPPQLLTAALWESGRARSRPHLEDLAQRIEPVAGWSDLVVPEDARATLQDLLDQVRHRRRVYEEWGFADKSTRGLGINALFAGQSGTGKTMAAEVLAHELGLDLFRIDLSAMVSKYIGETEKNLGRVFAAAEQGGAILLFDEADALFGKRSEVKDSHDRYANVEVSYLLQRMEAYRGLAILTTNLEEAIDAAFRRRLRFIVRFPFPSVAQRMLIWRQVWPDGVPRDVLDEQKLAHLNIAGGAIRNIALNAAFIAAAESQPVRMRHLLRAARTEYDKLHMSLSDAEVRGWL